MLTEEKYKQGTMLALYQTHEIINKNPETIKQMIQGTPFVAEIKFPESSLLVTVTCKEAESNACQTDEKKPQQIFCDEALADQHP